MNAHILHISLFIMFLMAGLNASPVQADCFQEEVCDAQLTVEDLLETIADEQEAIEQQRQRLDSSSAESLLVAWYERARGYVDVGSRYLLIGTLEGRLLVAYDKLGLVKQATDTFTNVCYCNDDIQFFASFQEAPSHQH